MSVPPYKKSTTYPVDKKMIHLGTVEVWIRRDIDEFGALDLDHNRTCLD